MKSADRIEFAEVHSIDRGYHSLDGGIDWLMAGDSRFLVRLPDGVDPQRVDRWLTSGAHVEICQSGTGGTQSVARVRARPLDGSPWDLRIDTYLRGAGFKVGGPPTTNRSDPREGLPPFIMTAALTAPVLDTVVDCYAFPRPELVRRDGHRRQIVQLTEFERTLRTAVRSIALDDGWLWRSIDRCPERLAGRFIPTDLLSKEEVAYLDRDSLPVMDAAQAILHHLGPRPHRAVIVSKESFEELWNVLDDEPSDTEGDRFWRPPGR